MYQTNNNEKKIENGKPSIKALHKFLNILDDDSLDFDYEGGNNSL